MGKTGGVSRNPARLEGAESSQRQNHNLTIRVTEVPDRKSPGSLEKRGPRDKRVLHNLRRSSIRVDREALRGPRPLPRTQEIESRNQQRTGRRRDQPSPVTSHPDHDPTGGELMDRFPCHPHRQKAERKLFPGPFAQPSSGSPFWSNLRHRWIARPWMYRFDSDTASKAEPRQRSSLDTPPPRADLQSRCPKH